MHTKCSLFGAVSVPFFDTWFELEPCHEADSSSGKKAHANSDQESLIPLVEARAIALGLVRRLEPGHSRNEEPTSESE